MSKQINLEEILKKELIPIVFSHSPEMTFNATLRAMKEACKQVLELASENAELNWIENEVKVESDSDFTFRDSDGNWCKISLDKRSILNIINEVE